MAVRRQFCSIRTPYREAKNEVALVRDRCSWCNSGFTWHSLSNAGVCICPCYLVDIFMSRMSWKTLPQNTASKHCFKTGKERKQCETICHNDSHREIHFHGFEIGNPEILTSFVECTFIYILARDSAPKRFLISNLFVVYYYKQQTLKN